MIYLSFTFLNQTRCDTDDKCEKADPESAVDHIFQSVFGLWRLCILAGRDVRCNSDTQGKQNKHFVPKPCNLFSVYFCSSYLGVVTELLGICPMLLGISPINFLFGFMPKTKTGQHLDFFFPFGSACLQFLKIRSLRSKTGCI